MLLGAGFLSVLTRFGADANQVFVALAAALALVALALRVPRPRQN
jgi:hypothetical protein